MAEHDVPLVDRGDGLADPAVPAGGRRRATAATTGVRRDGRAVRRSWFAWWWAVGNMGIFCLWSVAKPNYYLPCMPGMALLAGAAWVRLARRARDASSGRGGLAARVRVAGPVGAALRRRGGRPDRGPAVDPPAALALDARARRRPDRGGRRQRPRVAARGRRDGPGADHRRLGPGNPRRLRTPRPGRELAAQPPGAGPRPRPPRPARRAIGPFLQ